MGAFGFGAVGAVLFQSVGIDPAKELAKLFGVPGASNQVGGAINGAFNVFNDALGKKLHSLTHDEFTIQKIQVAQALNWDLTNATALVDCHRQLFIQLRNGEHKNIDATGLAKKLDIDGAQARKLLDKSTWRDVAINVVWNGVTVVGLSIVTGALGGVAASYIPISNEFGKMLTTAAAGQLVGRVTQEGLYKASSAFWSWREQAEQKSEEQKSLLKSAESDKCDENGQFPAEDITIKGST